MDHGSEVEPSKAPPSASSSSLPPSSSSSSSSSSHDFSRTEPETTLAAFSFNKALNDINDANGNYSIPREVFFASTSSASKVSDESASQNWSPMQSPPVQVMENSGEFDDSGRISISILTSDTSTPGSSFSFEPWSNCKKLDTSMSSASKAAERSPNGPPSSIFRSKSSTPTDWSHASNESLFSIQIGNHSFSGDLIFRSGEFETFGEHGRYGHMPVAHIGEDNKDALYTGVHVVPLGAGANGHSPSNFVTHPITKKPEPTRCEYCCTGWTCDHCNGSRQSRCTIFSGCLCAWLGCRGCSCKRLHCCCKKPKCPGGFCCRWSFPSCHCCKQRRTCSNCHCCKRPQSCGGCCYEFPCFTCYCCESVTCSCLSFKCPIWRSCFCHGSRPVHR
ncbi:hypothetical protein DM860_005811 [Cuscuta australis]|uniref:Uncharacterized protein n=1 Tax=Cuscuta australis TaxID=267555 RepID=A0A328DRR7_9ASTE|nr:hypothetical protein DM860_005811 [Cuscuta australis]